MLYDQLHSAYGPQGWWPLPASAGRRGFDSLGYHPGVFAKPDSPAGRFEVIMGAVLTQNTAWTNAATALARLGRAGVRFPVDILARPRGRLASLIRSSGYFNQKAKKLHAVAELFLLPGAPSREALLSQWGVGPETADSILLYAYHIPVFVVDAYTRRILSRIGVIQGNESYAEIQELFHGTVEKSAVVFNEYHALIVQHAKMHCTTRPRCQSCPVRPCNYRRRS